MPEPTHQPVKPVRVAIFDPHTAYEKVAPYAIAVLAAIATGVAWLVPGTGESAALGWCSAVLIALLLYRRSTAYLPLLWFGIISNFIGFHWLHYTISQFGGFSNHAAAAIFTFFAVASANQLLIFGLLASHLPGWLNPLALRMPIAWTLSEMFSLRIFPWHLGHTQIAADLLAQAADVGGAPLISFLMLWCAEAAVRGLCGSERKRLLLAPAVCLVIVCLYGALQLRRFSNISSMGVPIPLAIVQGNVPVGEKHDRSKVLEIYARYLEASSEVASPDRLLIWPETALTEFIPAQIERRERSALLNQLPEGVPLLIGALSYDTARGGETGAPEALYNSAFAIYADGEVPYPYHKLILMPFGEYTPFAKQFPWLAEMNSTVGNFTAGRGVRVFRFLLSSRSSMRRFSARVAPLICYEDIAPALARRATLAGAELLVNLTNDGWFGRSVAARQHHLIASFRAIENRRYLVRATNTGFTAIVDPLGETVAALPEHRAGTLLANAHLLSYNTAYTLYVGDSPWSALLLLSIVAILHDKIRRSRAALRQQP